MRPFCHLVLSVMFVRRKQLARQQSRQLVRKQRRSVLYVSQQHSHNALPMHSHNALLIHTHNALLIHSHDALLITSCFSTSFLEEKCKLVLKTLFNITNELFCCLRGEMLFYHVRTLYKGLHCQSFTCKNS